MTPTGSSSGRAQGAVCVHVGRRVGQVGVGRCAARQTPVTAGALAAPQRGHSGRQRGGGAPKSRVVLCWAPSAMCGTRPRLATGDRGPSPFVVTALAPQAL